MRWSAACQTGGPPLPSANGYGTRNSTILTKGVVGGMTLAEQEPVHVVRPTDGVGKRGERRAGVHPGPWQTRLVPYPKRFGSIG